MTSAPEGPKILAADAENPTSKKLVPVLTGPSSLTLEEANPTYLGFQLSELGSSPGETFTVKASDGHGLLSATGTGVSGNGTGPITITGTLDEVNAALATLVDTDKSRTVSDVVTLSVTDGLGNVSSTSTKISLDRLVPVLTGPSALSLQETNRKMLGVQLSEAWSVPGEIFTVTASANEGLFFTEGDPAP